MSVLEYVDWYSRPSLVWKPAERMEIETNEGASLRLTRNQPFNLTRIGVVAHESLNADSALLIVQLFIPPMRCEPLEQDGSEHADYKAIAEFGSGASESRDAGEHGSKVTQAN